MIELVWKAALYLQFHVSVNKSDLVEDKDENLDSSVKTFVIDS